MTHQKLLEYKMYKDGHPESQALCRAIAAYISEKFPAAQLHAKFRKNGMPTVMVYEPNFCAFETVGITTPRLKISLHGDPELFEDLEGDGLEMLVPVPAFTRIRIGTNNPLNRVKTAIDRAWANKQRSLARRA